MTCIVGIDIGGTKMLAGLVTLDGRVVMSHECPTRASHFLADATGLVARTMAAAGVAGLEVVGIGCGTTGFVDYAGGTLRRSITLNLYDVPIRDHLERAFGLPAFVDNDMHAATLGELTFGAGRAHRELLYVNAGTGIAVGMVMGGRLHRGATNCAGEGGHATIDVHGPSCTCGLPGCLEPTVVRARAGDDVPPVGLDRVVPETPGPAYEYLALAIVGWVNLLNPAAVVLAGGMYTRRPAAAEWTATVVRRAALAQASHGIRHFGISEAGAAAGLIGAAALVIEGRSTLEASHA